MPRLLPAPGPQRVLTVSTFANAIGSGIYLTAGVLYFTEAVRLPAQQVGLGLGIAGLVALGVGIGAGHLADRHGPRGVYAATLVLRALATAGFVSADGFRSFVLVVTLAVSAQAAGFSARGPIIKRHGGERPQELRAYLRSVSNTGISLGAVLAGWAVQSGTGTAYRCLIAGNALSFAVSAALLLRLAPIRPLPSGGGRRWAALRDLPYLGITALDGVMAVQFKILTVAVPLWLIGETTAPRWLVSAGMLTNTAIVVVFQVRASRNIGTPATGARAYRRAGAAFLASCSLVSLSAGVPAWAAVTLLLVAVVVHTVGELWHAAGGFEISFALAPEHATGQYLGVFGMGAGLAEALGPSLLIALCIGWGRPGWFVLGAVLALTGLVAPPAVRWAERRRPGAAGGEGSPTAPGAASPALTW
ncbi:MFS transporter [Streptomyces nojiriensis]|uniref:MFS transporter n=1 Tax=Streptomyces nojiriensis TaxID=66374 RepID=UPI0035E04580